MIAKNNIFNIRKGPKAWKGETGATKGFVEFETREHGIRAWIVLRDHGVGSEVNPESWTQLKGSNEKGI